MASSSSWWPMDGGWSMRSMDSSRMEQLRKTSSSALTNAASTSTRP